MGKMGECDSDIQIVVDEMTIEVSKTKEGLYVFNLLRFRPFMNDLDLSLAIIRPLVFKM